MKRVRFRSIVDSVSVLESFEDRVLGDEVVRVRLLSLPVTAARFLLAREFLTSLEPPEASFDFGSQSPQTGEEKAACIYEELISLSVVLSNRHRKSFLDHGGGKRLCCVSKDTRLRWDLQGFVILSLEDLEKGVFDGYSDPCDCFTCAALKQDPAAQSILAIMFARGFGAVKERNVSIRFWIQAADNGNSDACLDLGYIFLEGIGVTKNTEKAEHYIRTAAKLGNPQACFEMSKISVDPVGARVFLEEAAESGLVEAQVELANVLHDEVSDNRVSESKHRPFYWYFRAATSEEKHPISCIAKAQWMVAQAFEFGYQTEVDCAKAIEFYQKSARMGHPEAQRTLGYFHETGDFNFAVDLNLTVTWYRRAANQGDVLAQYNLSRLYWKGTGVPKNLDEAIFLCKQAANQGDLNSLCRLGEVLLERNEPGDGSFAVRCLDEAANAGHSYSQFLLGKQFFEGKHCDKNIHDAIYWFKKAASSGLADAQFALAQIYKGLDGTPRHDEEAFSWCSKAAQQGHAGALTMLARFYDTGKGGCERNHAKAVSLFQEAAAKNDPGALFYLAYLYQHGSKVVTKDAQKAFEYCLESAKLGDKRAQSNLGSMYKSGACVSQDYVKAAFWYRKSAEQDHSRGQANLGFLFENGLGVEKNYEEAAKWYYLAACQGNDSAQLRYAIFCQGGLGVKQNESEAVYWFECAAKQGNASALYHLGRAYEDGIFVEHDGIYAAALYQQAAEKGDAAARIRLAHMFESGVLVEKNHNLALEYLNKAAADGNPDAQIGLAIRLHHSGITGSFDRGQAYGWFLRAATGGNPSAQFVIAKACLARGEVDQALVWLERSALQGNVQAQFAAAELYESEKNIEKAKFWYLKAADHDSVEAQLKVVLIFEKEGMFSESFAYCKKAAEHGVPEAQFRLGLCYAEGKGCQKDGLVSSYWFSLASEKGHAGAQIQWVKNFLEGRGAVISFEQMEDLLMKASSENLEAALILAEQNLLQGSLNRVLKAYAWFVFAVENGKCDAEEKLSALEEDYPHLKETYEELKESAVSERLLAILLGFHFRLGALSPLLKLRRHANIAKIFIENVSEFCGESFVIVFPEPKRLSENTQDFSSSICIEAENLYKIGCSYLYALNSFPKDYVQAFHAFWKAASLNHKEAQYQLGTLHHLGLGVHQDFSAAFALYCESADQGYLPAIRAICSLNQSLDESTKKDDFAIYCFARQAVELGDKGLASQVSNYESRHPEYLEMFSESKFQALEERTLSFLSGLIKSTGSSSTLFRLRQSNIFSLSLISMILQFLGDSCLAVRPGEDLFDFLKTSDYDAELILKSAVAGDTRAQFQYAKLFFDGELYETDYLKAGYWFAQASRSGHLESKYHLAVMYDKGLGFKFNLDQARDLYEGPALSGHIPSILRLAAINRVGTETRKPDFLQSYCWYKQAQLLGSMTASREIEQLDVYDVSLYSKYRELRDQESLSRKHAFLMGLARSRGSETMRLLRYQVTRSDNSLQELKSVKNCIRLIFEFCGESLLPLRSGLDLLDILRSPMSDDEDEEENDEDMPIQQLKRNRSDVSSELVISPQPMASAPMRMEDSKKSRATKCIVM